MATHNADKSRADKSRADKSRKWRGTLAAVVSLLVVTLVGTAGASARSVAVSRPASTHRAIGLAVKGNHLVNARGQKVRLLGFNNSGAEYACMQGWGMFDVGTATNTSVPQSHVAAMARWAGANAVRISLNEQCWLGLAGVKSQYGGARYQRAIKKYVAQLNAAGFAVILDLHNSAPGNETSLNQEPMPDAHSVVFWRQVAKTFKGNRSVVFDVFNEPFPDFEAVTTATWKCWRDGGCTQTSTNGGQKYRAVGMQQLVAAVRSTGAHNVILLGGLQYASLLSDWLRFEPHDPDHQLAASIHIYSFGGCRTLACYNGAPAKVAKKVPVVIGELGADLPTGSMSCDASQSGTTGFDATLLGWAKSHNASWLAWTWNPWPASNGCLDLIKNFAGTPTSPYGIRIKAALKGERQTALA